MPTARLSMRRIRDALRLKYEQGLPERAIASALGMSNGVVNGYRKRARFAGPTWPVPLTMDDDSLDLLLFPAPKPASLFLTGGRSRRSRVAEA